MFSVVNSKTGKTWYLHTKIVQLRSGKKQTIFYFSYDTKDALEHIPKGYEISWIERSSMPVLKKIRK
jgi:hypothetical protein